MPAYFDKDKKTWYVKFWYKDYTGKRKQTTKRGFKLKKDALKYEYDFKEEQKNSANISFDKLAERYLLHKKQTIRKESYNTAKNQITLYILPYFNGKQVNQITAKDIINWHDTFLKPMNLANTSLRVISGRLSSLFEFARRYYNISSNPVKDIDTIGSWKRKKPYVIWTAEDLEKLCKSFSKASLYPLIFKLFFFTGMRPCELLALTPNDFDEENGTISITKSYHYDSQSVVKGYFTPPKNEYSVRTIHVPPFLLKALSEHVQKCRKTGMKRIFPLRTENILRVLKTHIKKLGLKEIRTYDLRHSHASLLIDAHQDVTLVAKRMGHSSPETTLKIYTHTYKDNTSKLLSFLDTEGKKIKPTI